MNDLALLQPTILPGHENSPGSGGPDKSRGAPCRRSFFLTWKKPSGRRGPQFFGRSSSGRTTDSDSVNQGSNPCLPARNIAAIRLRFHILCDQSDPIGCAIERISVVLRGSTPGGAKAPPFLFDLCAFAEKLQGRSRVPLCFLCGRGLA